MAIITPTVTAENTHQFREQIQRLEVFAKRIHLDLMDGEFAPSKSISVNQIFWSTAFDQIDIHLMYKKPEKYIDDLIKQQPDLIILHAEADGDIRSLLQKIKNNGIKAGVSLLKDSEVTVYADLIEVCDHVLVFSGNLGYFGGQVDLRLLDKVKQIRSLSNGIEIGWDGGINDQNAKELVEGGIDVLNVGGFIQRSEDPEESFNRLNSLI